MRSEVKQRIASLLEKKITHMLLSEICCTFRLIQ